MADNKKLQWSRYIPTINMRGEPYRPFPKQLAFLMLPHREALMCGSAGGGKSIAILMAACQYLHIPGYNALILRRALSDAKLASAIYDRAQEWFLPYTRTGEVKFDKSQHRFSFPQGSSLTISYLRTELDYLRYQSSEFQFIGLEELTLFEEFQYTFLFRSLRKVDSCNVPLRMRSSTNPTGPGMEWVKRRFRITWDERLQEWVGKHPQRKIIQAYTRDNEVLDKSYIYSLNELDPITRAQLRDGDWTTGEYSRFKPSYFSDRYVVRGSYFSALESCKTWHRDTCQIFVTIDPAGTQRSLPGGLNIHKNKGPAWSVIAVWARTTDNYLILLDLVRKQCEIPELLQRMVEVAKVYKPERIISERNGLGLGVSQIASFLGLPVDEIFTTVDKVRNSSNAQFRASKKMILLPDDAAWLDDFEEEVFTWMGTPNETDDQIDVISNAANYIQGMVGGGEMEYYNESSSIVISKGGWNNGRQLIY